MKKILALAAAGIMTLSMSLSAFAAPSVDNGVKPAGTPQVDGVVNEDVTVKTDVIDMTDASDAADYLVDSVSEDAEIIQAVDVKIDGVVLDGTTVVTIPFQVNGVTTDTDLVVLQKTADGWIEVPAVIAEDNLVIVSVKSEGPLVFAARGVLGARASRTRSPKTGDVILLAGCAAALGLAGVKAGKKRIH